MSDSYMSTNDNICYTNCSKSPSTPKYSLKIRIQIGCIFNSGIVDARTLADHFQYDVSHIYNLGKMADSFLDIFASDEMESVQGIIPVTDQFLEAAIICIRVIAQASLEDTSRIVRILFNKSVSVSTVSNLCAEYGAIARKWNESVLLSDISITANDEIFFGKSMILAGVDLKSTYVYGMHLSQDRTSDTWETFMLCLGDQGFSPNVCISDAGKSLINGVSNAFQDCFMQLDVFHTIRDLGKHVTSLERKAWSTLDELFRLENVLNYGTPRKKTKENYDSINNEIKDILSLVDSVVIMFDWIRELLNFTGYTRSETEELLQWISFEMETVLTNGQTLKHISVRKMRRAVSEFKEKRITKSLSFIDYLYQALGNTMEGLGVDPHAAYLYYNMNTHHPESDTYKRMDKKLNRMLKKAGVSRDDFESAVSEELDKAERASSFIENVNSRLRTALNDSRGMTSGYLALIMMYMNTKEYRRSGVAERVGKSPYELLTGNKVSFMDTLFPGFNPVLPIWRKARKAMVS